MNKVNPIISLLASALFSTSVYSVYDHGFTENNIKPTHVNCNNIHVEIDRIDGNVAFGDVFVTIDGESYKLGKEAYHYAVPVISY